MDPDSVLTRTRRSVFTLLSSSLTSELQQLVVLKQKVYFPRYQQHNALYRTVFTRGNVIKPLRIGYDGLALDPPPEV